MSSDHTLRSPKYLTNGHTEKVCHRCLSVIPPGGRFRRLRGEDGGVSQHIPGECPK